MNTTLLESVTTRANHLIDPGLGIWGWQITVYLFLGGMVAGILSLSALLELRRGKPTSPIFKTAPFVALGILSLGMVALFLDLEYPLHVWRFYTRFQIASPMSWGSWILVAVYPAAFVFGLGSLDDGGRTWIRKWVPAKMEGIYDKVISHALERRREILIGNFFIALSLGVYTGLLLGTMAARLQWNSALLGPLFLMSGISTGAAFLLLTGLHEEERKRLVRWDVNAIGTELVLILLMLIGFAYGTESARLAAGNFLGGPYTPAFWSLVVILGLVVPLLMEAAEARRHLPFTLVTPALVLVGGLALRAILLVAGQESAFRLIP
ncbi:MAG TPA: NrfD/PsrC family molybdoenzyme membrane anchor subunit [Thermoanaerobaculia bacterium]